MVEIERLAIQEENCQHEQEFKLDGERILMSAHYDGDVETLAARCFRPACWATSSLEDQAYVRHADSLIDAQHITAGSCLKEIMQINEPVIIREEKQGREQDGDDEIITLINYHGDYITERYYLRHADSLIDAQPIKAGSGLKERMQMPSQGSPPMAKFASADTGPVQNMMRHEADTLDERQLPNGPAIGWHRLFASTGYIMEQSFTYAIRTMLLPYMVAATVIYRSCILKRRACATPSAGIKRNVARGSALNRMLMLTVILAMSTRANAQCSGSVYPSSSSSFTGTYGNSATCRWYLSCSGSTVELSFSSFQMETNFDYVTVYDGDGTSSPQLSRTSGSSAPSTQVSTGQDMLVRLTADGSTVRSGFTAQYTCQPPPSPPPPPPPTPPPPANTTTACVSGIVTPTLSATSGNTIQIANIPSAGDLVFTDRDYVFDSLGSFTNLNSSAKFVRVPNNDKDTPHTSVMWTLNLPAPARVYLDFYAGEAGFDVISADDWLHAVGSGWTLMDDFTGTVMNGEGPGHVYSQVRCHA
jgi:hypothetical protein